jgi:FKBP-type peptidyl-prolyl cis-trans isomerase
MPGLTQALNMMREGDRWEIFIPARLAFKDVGPMAGQTVIYDLELVEILPPVQ